MEKILLVEDNEHIMAINTKYLSGLGYEIEQAYSVKQAKEKLSVFQADLIVLDVMLPDGDGVELCRQIRRQRGTPILFLTAKVADRDIIFGLESGGDEYLTKPYDLDVLGAKVKALLRRSGRFLPQARNFTIGSLLLDIVQSQAFLRNETLNLSRTEFGILLYLAQNRGRTVSKEELYQAVWGVRDEENGTMLWTAVSRLNRKIAPYEEDFYIDSDHSGYELIVIDSRKGDSRKQ